MGKVLMAAFALAFAAGPVFGTVSRDTALMGEGWKITDSTNSVAFPSAVLGYRDVFYGELGTASGAGDSYGVLNLSFGQALVSISAGNITMRGHSMYLLNLANVSTTPLGSVPAADVAYSNLDTDGVMAGIQTLAGADSAAGALAGSVDPDPRISVLIGMEAAQSAKVAFGVEYAGKTWEDSKLVGPVAGGSQSIVRKNAASVINLVTGVGVDAGMGNQVEVGLIVGFPSFEGSSRDSAANTLRKYESDGGWDAQFNTRLKISDTTGKKSDTFVMFSISKASLSGKSSGSAWTDGTKDMDGTVIALGVANNFRVTDSTMVVLAVEYATMGLNTTVVNNDYVTPDKNNFTTRQGQAWSMAPVTIGVESKVLTWLKVRMASQSSLLTSQSITASCKNKVDGTLVSTNRKASESSSQDFTLGVEMAATDKLKLDGVLTEELLFDGPYFITGNAIASTFGGASITLRF